MRVFLFVHVHAHYIHATISYAMLPHSLYDSNDTVRPPLYPARPLLWRQPCICLCLRCVLTWPLTSVFTSRTHTHTHNRSFTRHSSSSSSASAECHPTKHCAQLRSLHEATRTRIWNTMLGSRQWFAARMVFGCELGKMSLGKYPSVVEIAASAAHKHRPHEFLRRLGSGNFAGVS